MDYGNETYYDNARSVSARGEFVRKTYFSLGVGFALFTAMEYFLLSWGPAEKLAYNMAQNWLIVLLIFMGVSWAAQSITLKATSIASQWVGFAIFIAAEAVVFMPLLLVAKMYAPDAIPQAAILTVALTVGLTSFAFYSKKDFSFLAPIINIGFFVSIGLIVCALLFGFQLGLLFSGAMIVFAAICVLFQTSAIIRTYGENQYVYAAMGLFSSIALMFFYILQFLIGQRR